MVMGVTAWCRGLEGAPNDGSNLLVDADVNRSFKGDEETRHGAATSIGRNRQK
jgi:hypothetical protein